MLRMCQLWQELVVFKPIGTELEALSASIPDV